MSVIDKDGNWINRNGRPIPPANVDPILKKRDQVVENILKTASGLEKILRAEKESMLEMIMQYISYVQKAKGVKKEDAKGNYTLSDFANLNQVEVSINNIIEFDERLNIAKGLIDGCLVKWTKKGNQNIRAIVNDAFDVDKKGNVNKMRIFSLMNLQIKDKDWNKAMALIRESMQVTSTRQYLHIRKRPNMLAKWETVDMNFSSM